MSDNITLPREVAKLALDHIEWYIENERGGRFAEVREAAEALRTALAAPRPEPVATVGTQSNDFWKGFNGKWVPPAEPTKMVHLLRDLPVGTLLYTAPPAAAPEPVRHPGYVIGNHWLETAYSRICAGEAEADVLRDCGWERVDDAEALRRDAKRWEHHRSELAASLGMPRELVDAIIDAAMGEKR
jgi:hypothetical protein